ncbi:MAG: hypothetical protein ACTSRB_09290 [Candidatus Helarchaeota archaeon]
MGNIKSFEQKLGLEQLSKVYKLIDAISENFNQEKVSFHVKIGEDSFGLPRKTADMKKIIEDEHLRDDLEYISIFIPNTLFINFDFLNEKTIYKFYDQNILTKLKELLMKFSMLNKNDR